MYNKTFVKTYDLAKGGSTVDREHVNPVFPTANTFGDQVEKSFNPRYGPGAPHSGWSASNTLFAIFFGAMDMIIKFHVEQRPPVAKIIESYGTQLETVRYLRLFGFFICSKVAPTDEPLAALPRRSQLSPLHRSPSRSWLCARKSRRP